MKKILSLIGVAALLATTTYGQISETNKTKVIAFAQGVSSAKSITTAVYPTFAPDLINGDGNKDQWGAGVAAMYPFGDFVYTGLRIDYLAHEFYAPSMEVGLKADVQVLGINVTPFTYTGVVVPLQGAGSQDGEFGAIIGGGAKVSVWSGQLFGLSSSLSIAGAAEKWTQFDGMIYHIAPVFTIKW